MAISCIMTSLWLVHMQHMMAKSTTAFHWCKKFLMWNLETAKLVQATHQTNCHLGSTSASTHTHTHTETAMHVHMLTQLVKASYKVSIRKVFKFEYCNCHNPVKDLAFPTHCPLSKSLAVYAQVGICNFLVTGVEVEQWGYCQCSALVGK